MWWKRPEPPWTSISARWISPPRTSKASSKAAAPKPAPGAAISTERPDEPAGRLAISDLVGLRAGHGRVLSWPVRSHVRFPCMADMGMINDEAVRRNAAALMAEAARDWLDTLD